MAKEVKTQKEVIPDDVLSACINMALETEIAFKLYCFRVSDKEQFIARILDLSEYVISVSKPKNENNE